MAVDVDQGRLTLHQLLLWMLLDHAGMKKPAWLFHKPRKFVTI